MTDPEGNPLRESDLRPNMPLSYEVVYEASKGGEIRHRAIRVRVDLAALSGPGSGNHSSSSSRGSAKDTSHLVLLRNNVQGVIVRELGKPARRAQEAGLIKVTHVGLSPKP